jgi:hypothetical protein
MELGHAQWRKSSFSTETADCVEIAYSAESPAIGIRDSKNLAGGILMANLPVWQAFRAAITLR